MKCSCYKVRAGKTRQSVNQSPDSPSGKKTAFPQKKDKQALSCKKKARISKGPYCQSEKPVLLAMLPRINCIQLYRVMEVEKALTAPRYWTVLLNSKCA